MGGHCPSTHTCLLSGQPALGGLQAAAECVRVKNRWSRGVSPAAPAWVPPVGNGGVERRGTCGQDFLEKGDPGVWGREVTLGLKPRCCQTHNSCETQHRPTTQVSPQCRVTNRWPTQFHFRSQAKVTHTPHGPCQALCAHLQGQRTPRHTQACDPGRHAWPHTGNNADTPRHRQTNTSWECMDTQNGSGWGTQIYSHRPGTHG